MFIYSIKWQYLLILLLGVGIGIIVSLSWDKPRARALVVALATRGAQYQVMTSAESVGAFLQEQGIDPESGSAWPQDSERLTSGMQVRFISTVVVNVLDGQSRSLATTTAQTVREFLDQRGIVLLAHDRVTPIPDTAITSDMVVKIDRVVEFDEAIEEEVDFETSIVPDEAHLYGYTYEEQPGQAGRQKIMYHVTQKNGNIVSRKAIARTIISNPVPKIVREGRKVEVVAYESGTASWYKYRGCLCAAHAYYPKGTYLRVTRTDTNKSVIVRINDWGPDQSVYAARIVDLDSTAFVLLAPLSVGTTHVLVEKLQSEKAQ